MPETPDAFLKRQTGQSKKYITYAVFFRYLSAILLIGQMWLVADIMNALIFEKQAIAAYTVHFTILALLAIIRFALSVFSDRLTGMAAADIQYNIRTNIHAAIYQKGPIFVAGQGSGGLLNTLTDGVENLAPYYTQYLPVKQLMLLIPLTILIAVFPLDWVSGVIMLGAAPLIPVFMILIGKGAEKLNQKQWRELARMSNHFLDTIQGLTTLKLFNATRQAGYKIENVAENYRVETMKVLRIAFLSSLTIEFFSTVSIALVAVLIGFRLMWGHMDFQYGFFILLLAPEFFLPLRKMGAAYHARMEAIGAAEKMQEILNLPTIDTTKEKTVTELKTDIVDIQFKNVSFTYPDERKALNKVSMNLQSGKKYALTGPSGAGKSTLFSLLLGFIEPTEGSIAINNHVLTPDWQKRIAWIPQNPTLFFGTIAANIRMGKSDANDDDIKALCRKLNIHDFIAALPQGYNTIVGENGYGLSGGQIRRIAIARAFLRDDAPLVLMDEPTASLDAETEAILQLAMQKLTQNKTVLTIAHRLHTVQNADQIFYMKDGHIMYHGTHESLLKQSSAYAELSAFEIYDTAKRNRGDGQ